MSRKKLPARANKRAPQPQGRMPVNFLPSYDAAGFGRRMKSWQPGSGGPNATLAGLQTIRNRLRDSERNDWQTSRSVHIWTTNLIGTGITCRMVGGTPELRQRDKALWAKFIAQADSEGAVNLYGLQLQGTRAAVGPGECFVRRRWRRLSDGLAVPLQIQLMEPEQVPPLNTSSWPGMPAGNLIRMGVEFDLLGRRQAYWVWRFHPGEAQLSPQPNDLVRVPASEIRHVFEPQRIGQVRGVPDFASIIAKLRSMGNFDDAVLHRQEIANLFTMFHIRPAPEGDPSIDPKSGMQISTHTAQGTPLATLESGLSQELFPGEDVKFSDPPDAGTNYYDYMRSQNMGVAGGADIPYEVLNGDIKQVSDRTLRVIINEFRRRAEQRQWLTIIPQMCQPIREWYADAAALAGHFTAAEAEQVKQVTWQPQGWAYMHPTQDAQGKQIEVAAGFRSQESVMLERGDDPEEIEAQMERDLERKRRLAKAAKGIPTPAQP